MNDLTIRHVTNGFILQWKDELESGRLLPKSEIIQDDDYDEIKSGEELLWFILNYFGLGGSRYDRERLWVVRKRGDKYEPPSKT